ncbi:hypothetical protein FRA07_25630 [Klebsiella quasipneumoniae subsp. similipneumoniae]|nr:hypothetical protein FRA07_25630 [Klebsiella quasipneumoniae subsp. similipneumoniae]
MSFCPFVLLSFCPFVLLSFCPFVLLSFCPFVLLTAYGSSRLDPCVTRLSRTSCARRASVSG